MSRWNRKVVQVVLAACNQSGCTRFDIEFVDGFQPPVVVEKPISYHYETRGGRLVHYPSAYSKKGWSNLIYVPAVRGTIRVGAGWAISQAI